MWYNALKNIGLLLGNEKKIIISLYMVLSVQDINSDTKNIVEILTRNWFNNYFFLFWDLKLIIYFLMSKTRKTI